MTHAISFYDQFALSNNPTLILDGRNYTDINLSSGNPVYLFKDSCGIYTVNDGVSLYVLVFTIYDPINDEFNYVNCVNPDILDISNNELIFDLKNGIVYNGEEDITDQLIFNKEFNFREQKDNITGIYIS